MKGEAAHHPIAEVVVVEFQGLLTTRVTTFCGYLIFFLTMIVVIELTSKENKKLVSRKASTGKRCFGNTHS